MASARGDYEMSIQDLVVAVYSTHTEADQAVKLGFRKRIEQNCTITVYFGR
jgi:hypothetical protein